MINFAKTLNLVRVFTSLIHIKHLDVQTFKRLERPDIAHHTQE